MYTLISNLCSFCGVAESDWAVYDLDDATGTYAANRSICQGCADLGLDRDLFPTRASWGRIEAEVEVDADGNPTRVCQRCGADTSCVNADQLCIACARATDGDNEFYYVPAPGEIISDFWRAW